MLGFYQPIAGDCPKKLICDLLRSFLLVVLCACDFVEVEIVPDLSYLGSFLPVLDDLGPDVPYYIN